MNRYFKLYLSLVKNCLIREMEFRWHFILYTFINLIWAALAMYTFVFIFNHVETVAGWSLPQLLLLTATYYFFDRLFDTLFESNFFNFNALVNRGELDLILTKPVSGQFLVSLRQFSLPSLIGAASMLLLIIYLIRNNFSPVPWLGLLGYGVTILCGLVIVYSIWFITLLLVFWLGNIDNIHHLFRPIYEVARIPINVAGPVLRSILTYVLPLAFVATVPVQNFLGITPWWLAAYGLLAAGLFLYLSHRLWRFALKQYTSASS